jgi:FkbM family methyltransferase
VGQIQANTEALRAEVQTLQIRQAKLEELIASHFQTIGSHTVRALELTQLLHGKMDDVALRTRGALMINDTTFALRNLDGFVLVPRQDTLLLLMLLDAGPQGLEPGTRSVISKVLTPGMTFVDVGAHIGLLTLSAARAVGSGGKVLAVEPVPLSFKLLNQAITINGMLDRVDAIRVAAGTRRTRSRFYVMNVLGHSSFFQSAQPTEVETEIEVDVMPLDDLVQPGERVDLVKIDVEGAELAVLEGMTRIIAENPHLAIIAEYGPAHLKRNQITSEKWFAAFESRGFEPFVIDETSGACERANLFDLANVASANILFGRADSPTVRRAL